MLETINLNTNSKIIIDLVRGNIEPALEQPIDRPVPFNNLPQPCK